MAILARHLFALAALIQAPLAAANVQTTFLDVDDGNARALLEETSQYYVDAMHELILDRYPDDYRAIRWESLESAMTGKTVARFEYRYLVNGQEMIRVYQAMSGEPLGAVAEGIFGGPTRPPTPGTPTRPLTPESPPPENVIGEATRPDFATMDADDARFFGGFDNDNVRATIAPQETSELHSFSVGGTEREFDAEFKILRSLERDITLDGLPAGGELQGFVSTTSCLSCRNAMKRLAERHGLDIRVTQLRPNFTASRQSELTSTGTGRIKAGRMVSTVDGHPLLAHDRLADARAAQVRQRLSPRSMNRAFKGNLWTRRSIRLGAPRISEGTDESSNTSPPRNPDVTEPPEPAC